MGSNNTQETEDVLLRHLQAFDTGLDAILADYAEDCLLLTSKGDQCWW